MTHGVACPEPNLFLVFAEIEDELSLQDKQKIFPGPYHGTSASLPRGHIEKRWLYVVTAWWSKLLPSDTVRKDRTRAIGNTRHTSSRRRTWSESAHRNLERVS